MSPDTGRSTARGPVPLVVGVTGHTDLRPEDVGRLAEEVRRCLESLRLTVPHTPIVVLSPLAEGADRLVARVGLDLGLRLIVPLPLPIDDYVHDFAGKTSIDEFHELSAKAERRFVIPHRGHAPLQRPACYRALGAYVARHCHVLIALWNGKPSEKAGGTADVVRLRLEDTPPRVTRRVRLPGPMDTGIVYHLTAPRQSDPAVAGRPYDLRLLCPARHGGDARADELFRQICESTERVNRRRGRR